MVSNSLLLEKQFLLSRENKIRNIISSWKYITVEGGRIQISQISRFQTTNIQHYLVSSIVVIIVLLKLHQVAQHSLALLMSLILKVVFHFGSIFCFLFALFANKSSK